MNILGMLWGKTAGIVVGVVSLLVALLGVRHSIRKGAKNEMSAQIKERALEQIEKGEAIERSYAGMSTDDIIARMREKGLVRD